MSETDRLVASGITVSFGGVDVVDHVDLCLKAGEIHALTGENGAGKSSLAKAIAGVYRPRMGSLTLDGKPVAFRNPTDALRRGVALIHQEPATFLDLSVAENIFAGNHRLRGPFVDWKAVHQKAGEYLAMLGVDLDPRRPMAGLSVAMRQIVELASALAHDAQVWLFDETTAPLTPKEVAELFAVMRKLRDQGCALMMVTHHLHEVFEIADRITVLRDGSKVAELHTKDSSEREVVRFMVGRDLEPPAQTVNSFGSEMLRTDNLSGPGFRNVSLSVRQGEIVALSGLIGAGRTELARAIFGMSTIDSGELWIDSRRVEVRSPGHAMSIGLALVPEDRLHDGLLMPQSIAFNATLAHLSALSPGGWLQTSKLNDTAVTYADRLKLAYRSADQPVQELSGGNQQKVVLGKWLMTHPKVLILDEPTRGVDVGAKAEVHGAIRDLAKSGMAVLLISSDLPEVLSLSDRILVMRTGGIVAEIPTSQGTEELVMLHAAGQVDA